MTGVKQTQDGLWTVFLNVRGSYGRRQFKQKGISSKAEATRIWREKYTEFKKTLNTPSEFQSFRNYFEHYLKILDSNLMPSTIINYRTILPKWVPNDLWQKELTSITEGDIRKVIDIEKSDFYRKKILSLIKAILERAFREGLINRNPASLIKVKVVEPEKFALTKMEVATLLRKAQDCSHPYYAIWVVALFTGMRSGELFALKWNKVDFEHNNIYVVDNWTQRNGLGPTKGKYNRVVPINSQLKKLLQELKLQTGSSEYVLPHLQEWIHGEQAKVIKRFCRQIGIQEVRFHDLRATFITQMLLDGVSIPEVQKIVGHSDMEITSIYTRIRRSELQGTTEKLSYELSETKPANVIDFGKRR